MYHQTARDAAARCSSISCASPTSVRVAIPPLPGGIPVDDKQLAKLIRKNVAKVEKAAKAKQTRKYDPTLAATRGTTEEDSDVEVERDQFFKEMKRREF